MPTARAVTAMLHVIILYSVFPFPEVQLTQLYLRLSGERLRQNNTSEGLWTTLYPKAALSFIN